MKIKTSLGDIVISPANGEGVWIELCRPNTLIAMSVAYVEVEGGKLITRVWGNAVDCDYTHRIEHENVEDFFEEWKDEG